MQKVDLSKYDNSWFNTGASPLMRLLWYAVNRVFINTYILWPYSFKRFILRLFGATIERGVIIKPKVNIKYPWRLRIAAHAWVGEQVWIDNLGDVSIGAHACISQGALLITGNHDYTKAGFDLLVKPIVIEQGAWIGTRATVTPGVKVGAHAVLTAGSVASNALEAWGIYRGNPAIKVKERVIVP